MHRCAAEAPVHFSWQADAATRSAEGPGAAGTHRFQPAAQTGRRGGLFELQAENGVFLLRLALPLNG